VDVQALLRLDADLKDFVDDVFVSLRRKGSVVNYLVGSRRISLFRTDSGIGPQWMT
jgi:hypothetical protein